MHILNTIRYLIPNANVTVWEGCEKPEDYQGETTPIEINGCLIDWQPTNTQPCPTIEELEACDPVLVEQTAAAISEAIRKEGRDRESKQNMALVQGYLGYKATHPSVSFSEYLDYLETVSLDI